MQMRDCGAPAMADPRDQLPGRDLLAFAHLERAEMRVPRHQSAAMVNFEQIAPTGSVSLDARHTPRRRRDNRGAFRRGEIHALVELRHSAVRGSPRTECAAHVAPERRDAGSGSFCRRRLVQPSRTIAGLETDATNNGHQPSRGRIPALLKLADDLARSAPGRMATAQRRLRGRQCCCEGQPRRRSSSMRNTTRSLTAAPVASLPSASRGECRSVRATRSAALPKPPGVSDTRSQSSAPPSCTMQ